MEVIKLKVMFNRVREYMAAVQFLMIGYLFIAGTEFNLYSTILVMAVVSAMIAVLDFKYIMPREYRVLAYKNPITYEYFRRFEALEKKLAKLLNEKEAT